MGASINLAALYHRYGDTTKALELYRGAAEVVDPGDSDMIVMLRWATHCIKNGCVSLSERLFLSWRQRIVDTKPTQSTRLATVATVVEWPLILTLKNSSRTALLQVKPRFGVATLLVANKFSVKAKRRATAEPRRSKTCFLKPRGIVFSAVTTDT